MNQPIQNPTENPGLKGWHGSLELAYAQSGSATQLVSAKATAPLKMQRPFYPEGEGVCHSVILHTAGGIVGGILWRNRFIFRRILMP